MGAGIYNRETAIARSINTDTAMRWNQYVYLSQQEATRHYFARRDAAIAKDRNAYDTLMKRIQDDPDAQGHRERRRAQRGSRPAFGPADPQLGPAHGGYAHLPPRRSGISRSATPPKPWSSACRSSRHRRTGLPSCWSPGSPTERADFEKAVDEVRKENQENGQISAKTLSSLRAVIQRLKDKLAAMPLEDPAENQEALNFVKTVTAMARMLEKPDIDQVLAELEKIDKTTVGNLLAFMHTFNLRFAPATTPRQRQVYTELFPVLDQTRDRIISDVKLDDNGTGRAGKAKLHDFFSAMDLEHIEGRRYATRHNRARTRARTSPARASAVTDRRR